MRYDLLTVQGNPKLAKGEAAGYLSAVLHLYPVALDGHVTCPMASAGCGAACLNLAGRGGIFARGESTNRIQEARKRRTREFFADRAAFVDRIAADVRRLERHAATLGMRPAVRLNGTSDIVWERVAPQLFATFPHVPYYDYTKIAARLSPRWTLPRNYTLTFSRSETNERDALQVLADGGNVAVVFAPALPQSWRGYRVVDGDATDLRFLDPRGVVVGLKAKGRFGKVDATGFVIRPQLERRTCAGCGEYWPCSDSGRTDISGLERAKHHL